MKLRAIAAVTFAAGLVLAACGSDEKSQTTSAPSSAAAATTAAAANTTAAAANTTAAAGTAGGAATSAAGSTPSAESPTLAKATSRGHVGLGVKEDQPNLGYKDPTTGEYSGFDIEIARLMASGLGFDPAKIEYKA